VADVPKRNVNGEVASARAVLKVLVAGHRLQVAAMAAASLLGGLTEAVFLVVVTRAAFAITEGKHEMGLLAGHTVAVSTAMLLALGLVVFRIAMAVGANWFAATLNEIGRAHV
jgi:hypothetical protein